MREESDEKQPEWVEPHIRNLAKIHDVVYEGSSRITNFVEDHNLGSKDFDKCKVTVGMEKDQFHEMIIGQPVSAYLTSLKSLKTLYQAIHRECTRTRPVEERFDPKVLGMEDIEYPPPELFQIRDGGFPIQPDDLKDFVSKCRKLRNTADHISDPYSQFFKMPQKISWRYFIKNLVPLKIENIIELFVTGLQVIEYIADGTKTLITREYVETQVRRYTDKALLFIKPGIMKRALGANKWDKYIEVEHQETNRESIEPMAINRLDFLLRKDSPHSYVEINGWGGLGKTKLAREYISRSIDGELKYRPKGYKYYIYYTAKSAKQGEIVGEHNQPLKSSPRNWGKGGGDYLPGLSFEGFLQKIQTTFQLQISDIEDRIIEHLAKNEIFLLLDNFEDVSDADIPKYRTFFEKIPKDFNSRIVITSRRTPTYGAKSITLDRFNKKKAMEMLYTRYQHEIENNQGEERTNLLTQLRDSYTENTNLGDANGVLDLIDIILRDVKKGDGKNLETLSENLRHPLYLRYLANLLVNPTLIEQTKGLERVAEVLVHIIDDPQFKFWEWHQNVVKWMLDHAYNNVNKDPHTLTVLAILLNSEGTISLADLRSQFQKEHPELENPIKKLTTSIRQIESYREFVDEKIAEGEYALTSSARKYLIEIQPSDDKPSAEAERNVEVAPQQIIDFQASLQRWLKDGLPNGVGFRDGLYRLQRYVTSDEVDVELSDEVETKLFALASKLAPDTIEMKDLLDLLQLKGVERMEQNRFDLLCQKAEVYTRTASFDTFGDNIDGLARILLGEMRWPSYASGGPEPGYRGNLLILLLKIERHGIQTNIEPLISTIVDLLENMDLEETESVVQEYGYMDTFSEILMSNRGAMPWSEKLQQVFDRFNQNGSSDVFWVRFARIKPEMIRDDITISYHPDGSGSFENHESISTVNWDLISNQLTVFVQEKGPSANPVAHPRLVGTGVTQAKINGNKATLSGSASKRRKRSNPFAVNDPFAQWTSSYRTGRPGVSVDPIQLASDIYIVCELYTQVSLGPTLRLERGSKLKSYYIEYYRGSSNAHSAAFLIGFHSKPDQSLSHEFAGEALRKEFERRLKNSDEHKQEFEEWTIRFATILRIALRMLDPGPGKDIHEEVRSEIEMRKSFNDQNQTDLFNPRQRAIVDEKQSKAENENHVVNREDCKLPKVFRHALKDAQGTPWLDTFGFRNQLLKGQLKSLIENERILEHKDIRTSNNGPTWNLHLSWLESAVEFFFSGERYPGFFKTFAYSEKLVSEIEDYHFEKWFLS